jgi:hypothetical protein
MLRQALDQPLNKGALQKDLLKIYGMGTSSTVDFDLIQEGESTVLHLAELRIGDKIPADLHSSVLRD